MYQRLRNRSRLNERTSGSLDEDAKSQIGPRIDCRRVRTVRSQDERDHQPAEQAGPGQLHAEADEFVDAGARGPLLRPAAEPLLGGDEAGERRPQRGGAFGRPA